MVWIVQPLQRKGSNGEPSGLWHLTAESDEDGGFHVGCEHDHSTAEEAQTCKEALIHIGKMTGFPHEDPSDLRVVGVSRDAGNEKCLVLALTRVPTDDELRKIHDAIGRFGR